MKRFITSILCVSVFFIGLGAMVEKVGAKFKSDDKALALIAAARRAIGGEAAINNIRSLRVKGSTTKVLRVNGEEKSITGETEIAMQLPNQFSRVVKLGNGGEIGHKQFDVLIKSDVPADALKGDGGAKDLATPNEDRLITPKKADGTEVPLKEMSADGKKVAFAKEIAAAPHAAAGSPHGDDFGRTLLALFLSTPAGTETNYTYGGEQRVDGRACNVVVAVFNGNSVKLYLDAGSNLPVMISYTATEPRVVMLHKGAPAGAVPAGENKETVTFNRKLDGPHTPSGTPAEFQVRFSDYRSVEGVRLPHRWVTTINGATGETFEVATYEVNPANIAEAFNKQRAFVQLPKPDQK